MQVTSFAGHCGLHVIYSFSNNAHEVDRLKELIDLMMGKMKLADSKHWKQNSHVYKAGPSLLQMKDVEGKYGRHVGFLISLNQLQVAAWHEPLLEMGFECASQALFGFKHNSMTNLYIYRINPLEDDEKITVTVGDNLPRTREQIVENEVGFFAKRKNKDAAKAFGLTI